MSINKYTVVLLRPDSLTECDMDTYVAYVEATSYKEAIAKARNEVFASDAADGTQPESPEDYRFVMLFLDHCVVA